MLQAFLKVAESLSVSGAAQELGVGKSVVSKRVAQLESALGATLFSRSTRRIVLTAAGEAYLDFARRAVTEMAAGEERLRGLRSDLTGRIRMTAPVSWGQRVLARLLPDFLKRHPAIEIDLRLEDRMVDLAYERYDLALRWSASPVQDLAVVQVATVGWVTVATPSYLAAHGVPQVPADLSAHHALHYHRDPADQTWIYAVPDGGGVRLEKVVVRGRYHVDNPEAVADAALSGLGVALLPDYLCHEALHDGRLVRVLPAFTPQTRFGTAITAVSAPERLRLLRNQTLVDFLRQQFSPAGG